MQALQVQALQVQALQVQALQALQDLQILQVECQMPQRRPPLRPSHEPTFYSTSLFL